MFVEALDRCFPSVCELDLIFHYDRLHVLLAQMIVGGLVLDTSLESVVKNYRAIVGVGSGDRKKLETEGLQLAMGVAGWRPFG